MNNDLKNIIFTSFNQCRITFLHAHERQVLLPFLDHCLDKSQISDYWHYLLAKGHQEGGQMSFCHGQTYRLLILNKNVVVTIKQPNIESVNPPTGVTVQSCLSESRHLTGCHWYVSGSLLQDIITLITTWYSLSMVEWGFWFKNLVDSQGIPRNQKIDPNSFIHNKLENRIEKWKKIWKFHKTNSLSPHMWYTNSYL